MAQKNGGLLLCSVIVFLFCIQLSTVDCMLFDRITVNVVNGSNNIAFNQGLRHVNRKGKPWNRTRNRKRGKRAGVLNRLRSRSFKPPLPSIFLSNVRSLNNKADELFFLTSQFRDYRDCSIF